MNIPLSRKTVVGAASKKQRQKSRDSLLTLGAVVFTLALFAGCASTKTRIGRDLDVELEDWKAKATESFRVAPPAPELPSMQDFHAEEEVEELSISDESMLPRIPVSELMLAREMDVGVLLRALADAADLNIIVSNNVSGPVLVNLRRETRWDRLFAAIIEAHGLHYDLEDDLLRVFALEDVQRNIAMEQALRDQLEAAEQRTRSEPMVIEMMRVHYADLDRLAETVRVTMQALGLVEEPTDPVGVSESNEKRLMIRADNDSGQLIINGVPDDIARVRELVRGLDQPAAQILIEASIVQANSQVARELGFQWGAFSTAEDGRLSLGTTESGNGFNSNFPGSFSPDEPSFIYGISRVKGTDILQTQLTALQKDGRLNIVSTPSITTLDQQTAIIESGEERPFVSAVGTGIASFPQIEFKRAVLRLEVTPQVIDENWVKLDINTVKDEFDDARSVVIEGTVQVPILTRSALTSLYLADGQTTVIGGLSSETQSDQEGGIPGLKNLAGFGALFRNSSSRTSLNDTLIFITPHILPRAEVDERGNLTPRNSGSSSSQGGSVE